MLTADNIIGSCESMETMQCLYAGIVVMVGFDYLMCTYSIVLGILVLWSSLEIL